VRLCGAVCGVVTGVLTRLVDWERVVTWFSEASLDSLSREVERANRVLVQTGWWEELDDDWILISVS